MKKAATMAVVFAVALVILVSISFMETVKADDDYVVEQIDHTVKVMYNGYVLINDTITLNTSGVLRFLIGFPSVYGSRVTKCFAHSNSTIFPVTLNVPLSNRIGYYAIRVDFPSGSPQTFSVIFALSNKLLSQDPQETDRYTLDFPALPSLTKTITRLNGSVILPEGAVYVEGIAQNYTKENLEAFTYNVTSMDFRAEAEQLKIVDFDMLKREIKISANSMIEVADAFYITNRAITTANRVEVFLLPNASNVSIEDHFGRGIEQAGLTNSEKSRFFVTFPDALKTNQSTIFVFRYNLPSSFLMRLGTGSFGLDLLFFQYENYFINQASMTFTLPEGAKLHNLEGSLASYVSEIKKGVFQESITMTEQNILAFRDFSIGVTYEYNPLWLSFRPALWLWTISVAGCIIGFIALDRPRVSARRPTLTTSTKLRPEDLRAFVSTYEEKQKTRLETSTLEARMQKGRIPRRRYKVRTRMLEARLSSLSRNLTEYRQKMRTAGGKFAELMLQLEVAESELGEAAINIRSAEDMHNRGELSLEAHRKRLEDNERKKEKAEATINGILLRLREETH